MTEAPHILVVDDHREIRDLLGKYLRQHGYRVTLADGGEAMRRTLKGAAIDLVVLDLMMPGEDGLSLCRWVREKGYEGEEHFQKYHARIINEMRAAGRLDSE